MTAELIAPDGTITDPYRNFIAVSRYARWLDQDNRRETWRETVTRYVDFFRKHLSTNHGYSPSAPIFDEVHRAILQHEVMPSMRALMTAGPALERSHIAGYNCSFIAVDDPRAFDEAMYILLNGTGVGFSVESRHVSQLPEIPAHFETDGAQSILVEDSKEGWAEAFQLVLTGLWAGVIPTWDLSLIRPAGARLKTFGGRASGPEPLERLFEFAVKTFQNAAGRHLTPLEAHDLMCLVGDVVVSGGVRRSALISLSDLSDTAMATAKSGTWWESNGHRRLANNSAVYRTRPTREQFDIEWQTLKDSGSGERGIYNLRAAQDHASAKGRIGHLIEGVNPCAEILLRSLEFCNLTEIVIDPKDRMDEVITKVQLATIIGTWQSTLTDFKHLRWQWKANCEEERLLGVSLTGIYGNPLFNDPDDPLLPGDLELLNDVAKHANASEAQLLAINPSAAITCVKPSGTVSQLTGVSSGIHPWHSDYYIRSVRGATTDPLTRMLRDYEVPNEPDVMQPDRTTVFSFPVAAPSGAVTREDIFALDHLRLWAIYRQHWCDHNPSVTINVREHEWDEVAEWVWDNWDIVGGISFLPHSDHVYQQAPYIECDENTYQKAKNAMPTINWGDLSFYESEDSTTGSQELACTAGACEIVDMASAAA